MSTTPAAQQQIPIAKPLLGEAEAQAAYEATLSGWVTQGPRVQQFEQNFAAYTGAPYATAVSSCTTGLHLAMVVLGIGPGDEVICPSMSYIATANCIRYTGADAVLAEVDPRTYNLDLADTERRITPRTKAILVVHQMGMPADLDAFEALAKKHNLHLVEDAACAAGSSYHGRKIGEASQSDMVVFSFHPRKVITTGDGGMITTHNAELDARLKRLRQHGMGVNDRKRHEAQEQGKMIFPDHLELGYNYRMTDIQAAVGIEQLKRLDGFVADRRLLGERYRNALEQVPGLTPPHEPEGCISNWQSYSVTVGEDAKLDRDSLMQAMLDRGIATRPGIMTAHRETAYEEYAAGVELPTSELAADNSVLLPLFNGMTEEEQNRVIEALREVMG